MQWESMRKRERAREGESKQETLLESNKEDREEETRGGGGQKETDIRRDRVRLVWNGQWLGGNLGKGEPDRQKEWGGGRVIWVKRKGTSQTEGNGR